VRAIFILAILCRRSADVALARKAGGWGRGADFGELPSGLSLSVEDSRAGVTDGCDEGRGQTDGGGGRGAGVELRSRK
jgi:hypothetical protein